MYRDLGDIETKILQTIIHMGAQLGVQKVSSKNLAKECGIASATIFNRFKTMQNAYDKAAEYFDRKHMSKIKEMINDDMTLIEMWDYFLETLLADSEGCLYYISYTSTFGFDPTTSNRRADEFLEVAKLFFNSSKDISDMEYLLMWDYITTMAFYYAEKFLHYMPYSEENREAVRKIVFKGLSNLI